jgi:hypothetical protein
MTGSSSQEISTSLLILAKQLSVISCQLKKCCYHCVSRMWNVKDFSEKCLERKKNEKDT